MIEQKGQLFFDTEETGLTVKCIEQMIREDEISPLYPIAIDHFLNLTPLITTCAPKDLQWLKMEYTVPYFMDLAFRCRSNVYGVIFTRLDEKGKMEYFNNLGFQIDKCRKYNIIPTLLPITPDNTISSISGDKWCLIDAESYWNEGRIIPVKPDEDTPVGVYASMGEWEQLNNAVMAYVEDLCNKAKVKECLYQSFPGTDPSICWIDKDGVFNWMIIRTIIEDSDKDKPNFPEEVIEKLKKAKGKGHLCTAILSNPRTKGVLPRGEGVDIRMEIEDI